MQITTQLISDTLHVSAIWIQRQNSAVRPALETVGSPKLLKAILMKAKI